MKRIIPLLLACIIAGCAGPKPKTVNIQSDPPGARIFFGTGPNEDFTKSSRQYIGTAPFVWTCQPKGDGSFNLQGALVYSIFVPPVAVFSADPPSGATNLFQKRQVFHGGTIATPADKVPEGIFFDLTKP